MYTQTLSRGGAKDRPGQEAEELSCLQMTLSYK